MIIIHENHILAKDKCGELTLSNNDELLIHCIFCGGVFFSLGDFVQHIKDHRKQAHEPAKTVKTINISDILQIGAICSIETKAHENNAIEIPAMHPTESAYRDCAKDNILLQQRTAEESVPPQMAGNCTNNPWSNLHIGVTTTEAQDMKINLMEETDLDELIDFIDVDDDRDQVKEEEQEEDYIIEYLDENKQENFQEFVDEVRPELGNSHSLTVEVKTEDTDKSYNKDAGDDDYGNLLQTKYDARERLNTKEVLFELIRLFEAHRNLWDTSHEDFLKLKFRHASYNAITDSLREKFPTEPIKREMVRRRLTLLRKLFHKCESGSVSAEAEEICERLSFLSGHAAPMPRYVIAPNAQGRFECPVCNVTIKQRCNLTQHIRRHYKQYMYECSICCMPFYNTSDYKNHMRRHTNERPYICEICGKNFRLSNVLQRHIRTHAKNRDYKCHLCEKAYYQKDQLKLHLESHYNIRKEVCQVCDKKFFHKKYLTVHMRLHSEGKNYVCEICYKSFSQQSGLSAHKRTHKCILSNS